MEKLFLTIFGAVLPDSATRAGINAGLTASPQAFKVFNDAYQKQLQGFFIIGWLVLLGS